MTYFYGMTTGRKKKNIVSVKFDNDDNMNLVFSRHCLDELDTATFYGRTNVDALKKMETFLVLEKLKHQEKLEMIEKMLKSIKEER